MGDADEYVLSANHPLIFHQLYENQSSFYAHFLSDPANKQEIL